MFEQRADEVRARINSLLRERKITENSVAAGDSATQSRLNSQLSHGKKLTLDTILRILDACPDISAEWLLRGVGEMTGKPTSESNSHNVNSSVNCGNNSLPEGFVRELLAEKDKQIQTLLTLISK